MTVQPIDTLMAYKAINLAAELSNSEKRVAGAIIDHFNRRTNQCDPSLDCIAELIGMSRRTVIRATNRLQRLGFIRRIRHGGHYHRNKYEPVWSRFVQVEADWKARRSARRARFGAAKVSPCRGQSSHLGSDTADPQTCPSNQFEQTYDAASPPPRPDAPGSLNEKKGSPKESNLRVGPGYRSSGSILRSAPSSTAARDAAERRWNKELLDQYRSEQLVYGRIVDAIDVELSSSTTDSELCQRGSGLNYLIDELFARGAFAKPREG
jgi:hypothetical protein